MFPYPFSSVCRVYFATFSIHEYLKMYAQQVFSFTTYVPQHILALFQVKQALSFAQISSWPLNSRGLQRLPTLLSDFEGSPSGQKKRGWPRRHRCSQPPFITNSC